MKKKLFDVLACPTCKRALVKSAAQETIGGVLKTGALYCANCEVNVATVRYGKVDFIRVNSDIPLSAAQVNCENFHYVRIPWSDRSISYTNCAQMDMGWNSEGHPGCLFGDSTNNWSITINTDVTDLSLRFLSHDWSGSVSISVNGKELHHIDLYNNSIFEVKPFDVFSNLDGDKIVKITPGIKNPLSKGSQVYFFGLDAAFSGEAPLRSGNRGNGFPPAYEWCLKQLPPEAIVLDCGSGDRQFDDERVVSFEYLPFELPSVFGDGHALPFADDSFDVVFSQAVMEHMRNPYLAAKEIARVLKPGGLVYVESAFMQPLHAVPYHFFNTTPWGIEAIFENSGVLSKVSEWFGPLSRSVDWYLRSCGGGGLTNIERQALDDILTKADANINYEQLKAVASAVSYWGLKTPDNGFWTNALSLESRPTFRY